MFNFCGPFNRCTSDNAAGAMENNAKELISKYTLVVDLFDGKWVVFLVQFAKLPELEIFALFCSFASQIIFVTTNPAKNKTECSFWKNLQVEPFVLQS